MKRSLAVLAIALASLATAAPPAAVPHSPKDLLAVLPAATADWKIVSSVADNHLAEWLDTRATRVFQQVPVAGETGPQPAGEIEVSVVDTAGHPDAQAAFANFRPGKNGTLEKHLVGTLPAITLSAEDGRVVTQVLAASRYLIEITISNAPKIRAEDWLSRLHFDALPATPASLPAARPGEVWLVHVDELRPQNNRKYAVSTGSARTLQNFLKTLPAPPAEEASSAATTSTAAP